jgi:hypothetical protein
MFSIKKVILILAMVAMSSPLYAEPSDGPDQPNTALQPIAEPSYEEFQLQVDETVHMAVLRIDDDGVTRDVLIYTGGIQTHTTEIIEYFYKQYPHIDEILFHSSGGRAIESFELGSFLSNNHLKVTVPPLAYCMSACAFAFIGGYDYRIDGMLGFHLAHFAPEDVTGVYNVDDMNGEFEVGQQLGHYWSIWIMENGFSNHLTTTIVNETSKDNFLVMDHEDELMNWFVREETGMDDIMNYFKNLTDAEKNFMINDDLGKWLMGEVDRGASGHNDRGRPIIEIKKLWPIEAEVG